MAPTKPVEKQTFTTLAFRCRRIEKSKTGRVSRTIPKKLTTSLSSIELSPLLRLPGEIRNIIYSKIFDDLEIDPVYFGSGEFACRSGYKWSSKEKSFKNFNSIVGFTHSCRQIHAETRHRMWKDSSFEVRHPAIFADWMERLRKDLQEVVWAGLSPEQRGAVSQRSWPEFLYSLWVNTPDEM
ncbi:hypothetical protein HBH69_130060 [Parastagonospora nodorum]|nr:hypothetical protein HBI10_146140 [Parastagonospora nodorum]KAH4019891.1 hypothetical protein HBI13_119290 [Parastagonospora nodorum]KAH4163027.1 hypothetical protein HBH43_159650 [Parastagonospora nodorum]KAH4911011.1 hypothetical protein HBI80_024810 [Parastagonospora nodorum]KAH4937093.1 hypothetical protein HBH74_079760 [Parastagonospora nodorum]